MKITLVKIVIYFDIEMKKKRKNQKKKKKKKKNYNLRNYIIQQKEKLLIE